MGLQPFNLNNVIYYLSQPQLLSYMLQCQSIDNFYGHPEAPKCEVQQEPSTDPKDKQHDVATCTKCHDTMRYLLTPPKLQDIYPEAYECRLPEYSLFGPNLKLFGNQKVQKLIEISNVGFNFAPMKRFSMGFKMNTFDESCLIGEINYNNNNSMNDVPSSRCETSEFDEMWMEISNEGSFKPNLNSTFIGKFRNSSATSPAWKKAVVFDPSLSPPYNDAFPSLDHKQQEKRVLRSGNGYYVLRVDERPSFCVFCSNNAEPPEVFLSHTVKDPMTGKTTCPVLRKYRCIYCKAIGDNAHTRSYCPKKIMSDMKRTAIAYQKKNKFY